MSVASVLTYVVRIYLLITFSDLLTFLQIVILLFIICKSLVFNICNCSFRLKHLIIKLREKFPTFEVPNCPNALVTFYFGFTKPFGLMQIARLSIEFPQEIPQNHALIFSQSFVKLVSQRLAIIRKSHNLHKL